MPVHDRGRVLVDLAVLSANGGEAIADVDVLRHQREVFGAVASDTTVWRALDEIGARVQYSIGWSIGEPERTAITALPASAWTPAIDADGDVRDGAQVAELPGLLALEGWPAGMRVIVRRETPTSRRPVVAVRIA
jgi:hypothetical protein